MNARLPQDAKNPELERETRIEKEKNSAQERADLSLDIQTNNRSFSERVGDYIKNKQAERVKARMEKGEKPKEFSWMTLSSYLAVGAIGAVGAYKMTKWAKSLFKKDEEPKETEKKGLAEKVKEFPWGWGLGLLAATGFVFRGTFFNWFQNAYGLKLEGENLEKFIKTLKEKGPAGFQEARENLSYKSEPFIEHFAEEIHIEEKHLAELQTVSYKHFLEQRAKDKNKSYFTRAIEWADVDPSNLKVDAIPFIDVDDKLKKEADELKRVTQENHLADYIKAHKGELDLPEKELEDLTIGEILKKILEKRKKEDAPAGKEAAPENPTLRITDNPDDLPEGELSASRRALNRANKEAKSKKEYASIIAGGAFEDGATIVHNEYGTFIAKGPIGILITSGELLWEEFLSLGSMGYHLATGDYQKAGENAVDLGLAWYENHGVWFLGAGAGLGGVMALWNGSSVGAGILKGGLVGATLGPVGTIWRTIKLAKASISTAKATETGLVKIFTTADYAMAKAIHSKDAFSTILKKGEALTKAYQEKSLYHIEEWKRYYALIQRSKSQRITDIHLSHLSQIDPEHLDRMELFHVTQFANSWDDYQKSIGSSKRFKDHFDLSHHKDHRVEINEFMEQFAKESGLHIPQERTRVDEAKARLDTKEIESKTASQKIEALKESGKEADEYMQTAIRKIEEMKRENRPQTEIDTYSKEVEIQLKEIRERYKFIFEELKTHSKELSKEDQTALKHLLTKELSHASGVRGLVREVGERATGKVQIVFGVAALGIEYYELKNEDKELYAAGKITEWGEKFGWDVLQIVADVLSPFGASDWYTVLTGKEVFTGKEASGWDRFTRTIFGAYNFGTDALAAIGGGLTAEAAGAGGAAIYSGSNAIEGALRAAGKSEEVIAAARSLVPEVQGLAKALGGYQELFRMMKNVAGKGMLGVTAVEVGLLGKEIFFDTKDQKPIEIELPKAVDEENSEEVGEASSI